MSISILLFIFLIIVAALYYFIIRRHIIHTGGKIENVIFPNMLSVTYDNGIPLRKLLNLRIDADFECDVVYKYRVELFKIFKICDGDLNSSHISIFSKPASFIDEIVKKINSLKKFITGNTRYNSIVQSVANVYNMELFNSINITVPRVVISNMDYTYINSSKSILSLATIKNIIYWDSLKISDPNIEKIINYLLFKYVVQIAVINSVFKKYTGGSIRQNFLNNEKYGVFSDNILNIYPSENTDVCKFGAHSIDICGTTVESTDDIEKAFNNLFKWRNFYSSEITDIEGYCPNAWTKDRVVEIITGLDIQLGQYADDITAQAYDAIFAVTESERITDIFWEFAVIDSSIKMTKMFKQFYNIAQTYLNLCKKRDPDALSKIISQNKYVNDPALTISGTYHSNHYHIYDYDNELTYVMKFNSINSSSIGVPNTFSDPLTNLFNKYYVNNIVNFESDVFKFIFVNYDHIYNLFSPKATIYHKMNNGSVMILELFTKFVAVPMYLQYNKLYTNADTHYFKTLYHAAFMMASDNPYLFELSGASDVIEFNNSYNGYITEDNEMYALISDSTIYDYVLKETLIKIKYNPTVEMLDGWKNNLNYFYTIQEFIKCYPGCIELFPDEYQIILSYIQKTKISTGKIIPNVIGIFKNQNSMLQIKFICKPQYYVNLIKFVDFHSIHTNNISNIDFFSNVKDYLNGAGAIKTPSPLHADPSQWGSDADKKNFNINQNPLFYTWNELSKDKMSDAFRNELTKKISKPVQFCNIYSFYEQLKMIRHIRLLGLQNLQHINIDDDLFKRLFTSSSNTAYLTNIDTLFDILKLINELGMTTITPIMKNIIIKSYLYKIDSLNLTIDRWPDSPAFFNKYIADIRAFKLTSEVIDFLNILEAKFKEKNGTSRIDIDDNILNKAMESLNVNTIDKSHIAIINQIKENFDYNNIMADIKPGGSYNILDNLLDDKHLEKIEFFFDLNAVRILVSENELVHSLSPKGVSGNNFPLLISYNIRVITKELCDNAFINVPYQSVFGDGKHEYNFMTWHDAKKVEIVNSGIIPPMSIYAWLYFVQCYKIIKDLNMLINSKYINTTNILPILYMRLIAFCKHYPCLHKYISVHNAKFQCDNSVINDYFRIDPAFFSDESNEYSKLLKTTYYSVDVNDPSIVTSDGRARYSRIIDSPISIEPIQHKTDHTVIWKQNNCK